LKGTETQEGEAVEHPNTVFEGTEPQVEQHLEGGARGARGQVSSGWQHPKRERPETKRGNITKVTAAVTRYGCAGRASSKGQWHHGKAVDAVLRTSHLRAIGTRVVRSTHRTEPKRDEPDDRQQDATSLRLHGGETRRSGAKPQGRNESARMGILEPEAKVATPLWEWTPGTMSMDGWIYESHERWSMNSTGTH
jgi:hypothetical protein